MYISKCVPSLMFQLLISIVFRIPMPTKKKHLSGLEHKARGLRSQREER